jgi:hypothetical protein
MSIVHWIMLGSAAMALASVLAAVFITRRP